MNYKDTLYILYFFLVSRILKIEPERYTDERYTR